MTSARLPLTAQTDPDHIIAWRSDGPVTIRQFIADVEKLTDVLPGQGSVLNVCEDRYRFMVGLAGALVTGKVSLLPSSHSPEAVRQLREFAPDVFCLHDGNGSNIDLPLVAMPPLPVVSGQVACIIPTIPADAIATVLLTSGSTGKPKPHARRWGELVLNGFAQATRLDVMEKGHVVVGTVPPQHSYGLESTVLLSLFGNCAMWHGRPFYPADIVAALESVPQPRLLVTTPFHLRTLLESGVTLPPVDQVLSATAPLSEGLARTAEEQFNAPLREIYGCTETGQLASRRTSVDSRWLLLPDIRLEQEDGVTFATGGHIAGRQMLGDIIELHSDRSFSLCGRNADLINIAGKRTSLGYLNVQLTDIKGVLDGCFFMPDELDTDGITRLCAFVVAPTLTVGQLRDELRLRIDPIFLPRPIILVERLPRNETGKPMRSALQALLAEQQRRVSQ